MHRRSKIDLAGLVHQTLGCTTIADEFQGNPALFLAKYGIQLPPNLSSALLKLPHPIDLASLSDCSDFGNRLPGIGMEQHPLELRLFWYGARNVVFLLGTPQTLRVLGAIANQRGCYALLTPYQWILTSDQAKNGYSNTMYFTSSSDTRAGVLRGLVVARAENDLALAWLSSTIGWDSLLGQILGYPECCISSFCKNWPEAQAHHSGDLVPFLIKSSGPGPFDWRTNILGRYFDRCLLQHFPCLFGCEPTIQIAQAHLDCLEANEPILAEGIIELMSAPTLYTERSGIFVFPDAQVDICSGEFGMRYDPIRMIVSTRESAMYRYLSQANTVVGTAGSTLRLEAESDAFLLRFD